MIINPFAIFVVIMLLGCGAFAFSIGNLYLGGGMCLIVLVLLILLVTEKL